jgi:hypothetical protein
MSTKTQPVTGGQPAATSLTNEEILRYSRHLIMPEVGMDGQLKLKNAKVLLIGTGGLGAPLGLYLTAAGVGKVGLVDFDVVDFTNLQRQVTFGSSDVGKPKTEAARARLSNLNPDVEIATYETKLTSENALELFKDYDIIVDGTDNFPTRYLVNDACLLLVDFPFRRASYRVWHAGWALLPLFVSGATSAGAGAFVRRRWRVGRVAGNYWLTAGNGNDQTDSGSRGFSGRAFVALRCSGAEIPRAEAAEKCELPDVQQQSHYSQADRLQRILRNARRRRAGSRSACAGNDSART